MPSLRDTLDDLAAGGHLLRIEQEIDPYLEAAEIHRRVYAAGGPAIYYARVKGCQFPMVSNLFGSTERISYMFRRTLPAVEKLVRLKVDPSQAARRPWQYADVARALWNMRPRRVRGGPVLSHRTTIDRLPQMTSWPRDGGPFITLPQVYTEDPRRPGWRHANLGMYRVQLAGNEYRRNAEIGLHYQIHRGIGVHHTAAVELGAPLKVSIFIGGHPAMTLSAVMPLPEGLPELALAGALAGSRVRLIEQPGMAAIAADVDFCITGAVDPTRTLPEGPFGDHLGYYSLAHDFPVLRVDGVYHRPGAIWPFTVVGRPPQEDTGFGQFIHQLTGPVIPTVVPGVKGVHAVDAAGVHPLLLAIGSERYVPYVERTRPAELLTQASAIAGQGQMSLAKYLLIVARNDDERLDVHDIPAFFNHLLRRVDWSRDLHFQTCTTIDTLDYSGTALNEGSKLVVAAAGPPRRELPGTIPRDFTLPAGYSDARVALPGVLVVQGPRYEAGRNGDEPPIAAFCSAIGEHDAINRFPLVVVVDDSEFAARTLNNFLWVTFTRSDPAADISGVGAFIHHKHWGCRGALVIDARIKPHHAPPLESDPEVSRRVEALAAKGGPLHGVI